MYTCPSRRSYLSVRPSHRPSRRPFRRHRPSLSVRPVVVRRPRVRRPSRRRRLSACPSVSPSVRQRVTKV